MQNIALRLSLLGALIIVPGVAEASNGHGPPLKCESVTFNVSLAPNQPADQQMVATMCSRGSVEHKTIQVLIHGGTYDHNYWDFPYDPDTYSYVRDLTDADYVTLNVDRIGSGASSHPLPGSSLTLHTAAFTIHQVVQTLRSGGTHVHGFGRIKGERIMLVGHSMGSVTASIEAATWNDVDGVILSAYAHSVGPGNDVAIGALYPAPLDPKFANAGLTSDYLTTIPGTRGMVFYNQAHADPNVIALDEQLKGTATVGELGDILPSLSLSMNIQAPTLVAVGDLDTFLCPLPSCTAAGFSTYEPPNFGPHACVETAIIPESGHDINLHHNGPSFFALARSWADRRVGASTKHAPPQACP